MGHGAVARKTIRRLRITVLAFATCVSGAFSQDAYQWPVKQKKQRLQISSTFGESRNDHFHNGLDIPGENKKVRPVANGQILWQTSGTRRYGEIQFGGGGTVIVRHKSLVSGYMHLKGLRPLSEIYRKPTLKKEDSIGLSGKTGHSGGAHLHFFMYKMSSREMINPLLLLSDECYQNKKEPRFQSFAIALPDSIVRIKPERPLQLSGDYPLLAEIIDAGVKNERWGIYSLRTTDMDSGKIVREYLFNKIVFRQGAWLSSGKYRFEDIYAGSYYKVADRLAQNPNLQIQVQGYKGPGAEKEVRLQIIPAQSKP